ncbi:hypothetical protein CERSUDRAFT_126507 [Gelatoporia subvermispora B]|uniref:Pierisin-like domain-containing protein n=1 Tax=Ceriporiopsis subvermispora (strain B) TaxID=914234 RepID=M2PAW1_CERS8|nr:hypothetical protein CERSUDRAFT_126507 [Gelatoporia subvermispora B]
MNRESLHTTAALEWPRKINEHETKEIYERLNKQLNNVDPRLQIAIRPDLTFTPTKQFAAAASEPLTCWDTRHPNEIFGRGCFPLKAPSTLEEFRNLDDASLNIHSHVVFNSRSFFISATRYVMHQARISHWAPAENFGWYAYEVFAPGGIDAAVTFNLRAGVNISAQEQAVVFPGGIRTSLIRSAREYGTNGVVVRVWRNLFFNPFVLGDRAPSLIDFPAFPRDVVKSNNITVLPDSTGSNYDGIEARATSATTYVLKPDIWHAKRRGSSYIPRSCFMLSITPSADPVYFFADMFCVQVKITYDSRGACKDALVGGVHAINNAFPALLQERFTHVDAAMLHPVDRGLVYFFCRNRYALLSLRDDKKTVTQRGLIGELWSGLRKAKIEAIDAVLTNPLNDKEAYLFSGQYCLQVIFDTETNNFVTADPGRVKIDDQWTALKEAKFDKVDAILPTAIKDQFLFFKGDEFILSKFTWNSMFSM